MKHFEDVDLFLYFMQILRYKRKKGPGWKWLEHMWTCSDWSQDVLFSTGAIYVHDIFKNRPAFSQRFWDLVQWRTELSLDPNSNSALQAANFMGANVWQWIPIACTPIRTKILPPTSHLKTLPQDKSLAEELHGGTSQAWGHRRREAHWLQPQHLAKVLSFVVD